MLVLIFAEFVGSFIAVSRSHSTVIHNNETLSGYCQEVCSVRQICFRICDDEISNPAWDSGSNLKCIRKWLELSSVHGRITMGRLHLVVKETIFCEISTRFQWNESLLCHFGSLAFLIIPSCNHDTPNMENL